MQDVFHEAVAELEKGNPMVVATVVHTKGSTPQKPGAKLLVRDDGSGVGTLGGGCVEGDIWFAASQLLKRGGASQYRDYELNEDLAAQDGLVCGGTMYFVIDPIYSADEYLTFAQEIDAAYSGGPSVALATLIQPWRVQHDADGREAVHPRERNDRGHTGRCRPRRRRDQERPRPDGDGQEQAREVP